MMQIKSSMKQKQTQIHREQICGSMGVSPGGSEVKGSASNAGDLGSIPGFDLWVRKIPWRRKWQPTPVFSPGESHGWKSSGGYHSWGHKESKFAGHKTCGSMCFLL